MTMYPPRVAVPVYAVFTAIAIALTGLRFWARIRYTKGKLGLDDWLALVGVFIVCLCSGMQFYNAFYGTGGEATTDEDSDATKVTTNKINFSMVVIEKPAFGAIKLSFLYFYKRVFGVWKSFQRANNIIAAIIVAWVVAFVVADIAICGDNLPYYFLVDQTKAQEHCANKGVLLLMFAITSVVTDLLVLGLPFVYLRRLQMPPQKKWATGIVLFLGFVATAAGLLRTIFLGIAVPMGRLNYVYDAEGEEPLVLQVFNPTFWVMMEMLLGAWAVNMPPLGPLLGAMGFREFVSKTYNKISHISNNLTGGSGSKSRTQRSKQDTYEKNGNLEPKNSDSSLTSEEPAWFHGSGSRGSNADQFYTPMSARRSWIPRGSNAAADPNRPHVDLPTRPRGPSVTHDFDPLASISTDAPEPQAPQSTQPTQPRGSTATHHFNPLGSNAV